MVPEPSHTRRSLLSILVALAGCAGVDGSDPDRTATVNPALDGTPSATATRTAEPTPTGTPAGRPTPTAARPGASRFTGRSCPSMLDGCFHRADADTPVFLRPSGERVDLGGEFSVSLVNRHDEAVFIGPYYWAVWVADGDGWTRADDRDDSGPLYLAASVPPGDTYEWTVRVTTDGDGDPTAHEVGDSVAFSPGLYCFGLRSDVPLSSEPDPAEGHVGALFEVE